LFRWTRARFPAKSTLGILAGFFLPRPKQPDPTPDDLIRAEAEQLVTSARAAVAFYDRVLSRQVLGHRLRLDAEQAALGARVHLQALLMLIGRR
jgi:hypothetical protein